MGEGRGGSVVFLSFSLSGYFFLFVFKKSTKSDEVGLQKANTKRKKNVWSVNPLFNGRELEMLLNEVYLLKVF